MPPESQFAAISSGILESACSWLSSACTFADSPPWYRAPPMWYLARISALVNVLPLNMSAPKWKRLTKTWPTFSSSVIPARVCSTQSTWEGSRP